MPRFHDLRDFPKVSPELPVKQAQPRFISVANFIIPIEFRVSKRRHTCPERFGQPSLLCPPGIIGAGERPSASKARCVEIAHAPELDTHGSLLPSTTPHTMRRRGTSIVMR